MTSPIQRVPLRPVVLIGMRGAGKTTAGRMLAERIGGTFLDTDEIISRRAGCSITELFTTRGEPEFREMERHVLLEMEARPPDVLAVGGGAVMRRDNVDTMRRVGVVIWLQAPAEVLARRLLDDPSTGSARPSLTGRPVVEELSELLARRETLYAEAADMAMDVSDLTAAEVVARILEQLSIP